MFRKLFLAALAAAAALTARPATSAAQKALVYCPTGADAGGCARIAQAIAGKFAQVDKAYDGTDGTIDLRTADLDHYAVIVVPSLADAAERTPYDLLRKEASRIRMAATGRVAVFSGAPDQGAANREAKDVVIANLVSWAAAGHTRPVGLVGLVAFQDLSEHAAARYDWVRQATPVEVSADVELRAFRSVQTQATARASFFRKGDAELAYPNMASYGLHIGAASPARTVSAATAGDAGQTVLVTYGEPGSVGPVMMAAVAGGDTAWIDTDKPDYLPGDTVTFTGGNWAAGDTVRITLHEDPHWSDPDRVVTAIADANGKFTNRTFVVDQHDYGVTFTATAVATSGKTATDTFTDGQINNNGVTTSPNSVPVTAGSSTSSTVTVSFGGNSNVCTVTLGATGLPTGAAASFSPASVSGANGAAPTSTLTISTTGSGANQTPAGTYTITVTTTLGSGCNGSAQTGSLTLVVGAAAAVTSTTVNAATATYGDAAVTLSATVTSSSTVNTGTVTFTLKDGSTTIGVSKTSATVSGGNASVSYDLPGGTAVKSYTIEAVYNAGSGFATSSGTGTLTVGPAPTTTAVTCASGTYTFDGTAKTPCSATVTGAGGLNQSLTVSYSANTNAGTATASASFAATTNYQASSDSKTFTIDKAASTTTVTCGAGPFTYDGNAQTPCSAAVTGAGGLNLAPTPSYANNVNAGTATASYTYAGDANHTGSSDSETFTIGQASSTVTVSCPAGPFPYTGAAQTPCSAEATGAGITTPIAVTPISYTNNVAVGTATASATWTGDANHTGNSGSATFAIAKAATTTTVACTGAPFTYTGSPVTPCTASVTGPGSLNQTLTVGYSNNTNAGTATASASYAGDGNYEPSSDSETFEIGKATSTTTVACAGGPFTYDGSAQTPCSATVTGVGLSLTPTPSYSGNVNAGTATASYTYAGDANHTGSSDSETFTIGKASSSVTVSCPAAGDSPVYTGSAQEPCTAAVSGAGTVTGAATLAYSNNTNAGTATVTATYAGDDNHTGSSGSGSFTIKKATSSTMVSCTGAPFTYDGTAQTPCSATATGVGGLSETLTVSYANNTNAGIATASASYGGDTNHEGSTGSTTFTIDKAPTTTVVSCPAGPFTYDGSAKTPCSASVSGVAGLSGPVTVTYSNNVNAGTATATATYATSTNYLSSTDSKTFAIDKATSAVTVTCPAESAAPTYTGSPLTPCSATATGAGGLSQSLTPTYTNNVNAGTGTATASASFDGDDNHTGSSSSATFSIKKAASTTTVSCTGAPFTYNATAQTPCSASATGAGISSPIAVTPVGYTNNVNAGTAGASATWAGDANHESSTGSTTFTIDPAPQTISWSNPADITYPTALGGTQLNASVTGVTGGTPVGGTTYVPAAGTVLLAGTHQPLTVNAAATTNYLSATKTVYINVGNAAPVIDSVTGPLPVAGTATSPATATVKVYFRDAGQTGDLYTITSTWTRSGGGSSTESGSLTTYNGTAGVGSITESGLVPGVYTVTVTVADRFSSASDPFVYSYVVVYDPSSGFVTGGGWIVALDGSCVTASAPSGVCASATGGRANFGFTSKYQRGQQVPTGNTEFQFQAGNLNFKSTNYEWLVLNGTTQAQFKGTGTINGAGNFGFLVTAMDGDNFGGTKRPDAFRIKIWDINNGNAVVFDNKLGSSETDLNAATDLRGGSIQIQSK